MSCSPGMCCMPLIHLDLFESVSRSFLIFHLRCTQGNHFFLIGLFSEHAYMNWRPPLGKACSWILGSMISRNRHPMLGSSVSFSMQVPYCVSNQSIPKPWKYDPRRIAGWTVIFVWLSEAPFWDAQSRVILATLGQIWDTSELQTTIWSIRRGGWKHSLIKRTTHHQLHPRLLTSSDTEKTFLGYPDKIVLL